jgi:hypothetical protein
MRSPIEIVRSTTRNIAERTAPLNWLRKTNPALEGVYQEVFRRDLARAGIVDDFYPFGGASNYGLMYIIFRIANELRPTSVLDVGAGQSTILWNRLLNLAWIQRVLTVESDQEWAQHTASRADHEILCSPLNTYRIGGRDVQTYDWESIRARGPFDVVLCDGPRGTQRYSRFGVVDLVDSGLPEDFVIVIDDAERTGEQDTISSIVETLRGKERRFGFGYVRGQKNQAIIAAGKFERAVYFGDRASL